MFTFKNFYLVSFLSVIASSSMASSEALSCKFVSRSSALSEGRIVYTQAKFDCLGEERFFVASSSYNACKSIENLNNFLDQIKTGEEVGFEINSKTVGSTDGSSKEINLVLKAISDSGVAMEPATIISKGKPYKCNDTAVLFN